MKEIRKEKRNDYLINKLLYVWEDSVRATHKFLSDEEINTIKEFVPQALKNVTPPPFNY